MIYDHENGMNFHTDVLNSDLKPINFTGSTLAEFQNFLRDGSRQHPGLWTFHVSNTSVENAFGVGGNYHGITWGGPGSNGNYTFLAINQWDALTVIVGGYNDYSNETWRIKKITPENIK